MTMYKPKFFSWVMEKNLIPPEETEYVTENLLQDSLENQPDLLPGKQIAPDNPQRRLLVAREMRIQGDLNESDPFQ